MKLRYKRKQSNRCKHFRSLRATIRGIFKRNVKYRQYMREDGSIGALPEYRWTEEDKKYSFAVINKMKKVSK